MSSFFSGVSSLSVMVQGLRQVPRWVHNTPQYTCVFFPIFKMSELCLLFCRDGLAIILLMLLLLLRTRSCACYRMFRFGFFKYRGRGSCVNCNANQISFSSLFTNPFHPFSLDFLAVL